MMDKKKILYIVEAMGGGVFTYIVDLANNLCEKFDVYIAYGIREQTPKNYSTYFDERVLLIEVKHFTRELNFRKDIKSYYEIKQIAKSINPNIIHLHSSKAGVLGRLAFSGKKSSLFYTPHGYSFLMSDASKIKKLIYKLIEWLCGLRSCTTISCSLGEHKETIKLTPKAIYINNGINMNELDKLMKKNKLLNQSKKEIKIFTLGRICTQKNPELFNLIAKKMPTIKFIWIGDGDLRSKLTSDNIEVTGWLTREDAIKIAQSCNIFMLTSLWEGLPLSLIESMYMKKLCVVSNVIGNNNVVKNGINGYVCDTEEDFLQAINNSINHDQLRLVETAYKEILNTYNIDVMLSEYEQVYNGY